MIHHRCRLFLLNYATHWQSRRFGTRFIVVVLLCPTRHTAYVQYTETFHGVTGILFEKNGPSSYALVISFVKITCFNRKVILGEGVLCNLAFLGTSNCTTSVKNDIYQNRSIQVLSRKCLCFARAIFVLDNMLLLFDIRFLLRVVT